MSSFLHEDVFGTSDAIIVAPGEKVIVIDFKYGRGVTVEPDSAQLKYYAYLAIENFEGTGDETVELWIVQPRIPHSNGLCRSYDTTAEVISSWFTNDVMSAIRDSEDPEAPLTVGDWCLFCPVKEVCPAIQKETLNFDSELDPSYLNDDELGDVITKLKALIKALPKFEEESFVRARRGKKIRGLKLVRKKANRIPKESMQILNEDTGEEETIIYEDAVLEEFGDDAYKPREFKTPPQLEKLPGGTKFVAKWAYTPDTGLTMAPESDSRDEVEVSGEEFFGELDI
jgi:hypothetical protein